MLNILATLSPRELDTLNLISNGCTRKEICEMRCVEMSTVKSQIHSILKKFNKKNIQAYSDPAYAGAWNPQDISGFPQLKVHPVPNGFPNLKFTRCLRISASGSRI